MREVVTYTTIGELMASPIYDGIRELPHIGMSSSFIRYMSEMNYFEKVTTFHEILGLIAPDRKSESSRIVDLATISQILRKRKSVATTDEERLWLEGCLKQAYPMWSAIMLLEEAEIKPSDVIPCNRNQRLFVDVWSQLQSNSRAVRDIRSIGNDDDVERKVISFIDNISGGHVRKVVVHGFYFITPIQERLTRLMEHAGFDIIYLFQYDDRYGFANEVWERLYNPSYGLPDKMDWFQLGSSVPNDFGDMLEGLKPRTGRFRFREYRCVSEFVNDPNLSDQGMMYSADPETANGYLREFHPEWYGCRPLITYPIGGFIDSMHRMWDEGSGCVLLDVDTLSECFAYGWITNDGKRSSAYMRDLQNVKDFFKGCATLDEWKERLGLLREIQEQAVGTFETEGDDRWAEMMGSPLSNFSQFSLLDGGKAIIRLIEELIICIRSLFGDGHGCSIVDHMKRLIDVLSGEVIEDGTMENELNIALQVISKSVGSDGRVKFLPADLSNAVSTYLNNEYGDDDDQEYVVHPMHHLEASFTGDVHMVLSDMNNLPGGGKEYTWPLNSELVDSLEKEQALRDPHPLIGFLKFVTESASAANRHLMFNASWARSVTISWIRDIDGKAHSPSPYVELICGIQGLKPEHLTYSKVTHTNPDLISPAEPRVTCFNIGGERLVDEPVTDLMLCPMRFVYGYVLNRRPVILGEFQQAFTASALISALRSLQQRAGFDRSSIEMNVKELFPNLTNVEMHDIIDRAPRPNTTGFTHYKGRDYTNLRLMLRFPTSIEDKIKARREGFEMDSSQNPESTSRDDDVCMHCPHSYHCRNAVFKRDGAR